MAKEYDIQAIMNTLKTKEEMDPDQHDGCYELMRVTIEAYGKVDDYSVIDYKDLNLVYLTTVGTWKQGIESKKKTVNESHLLPDDKGYLIILWDEIWEKAGRGEYTNYEMDAAGNRSIGMFGTGFFSFQRTTTDVHAQAFIKMCVDILPMTDDMQMYDRASEVLTASFKGMKAASASMILHCLKPSTFPVLNSNMGNRNIFEVLGVNLVKRDNIETYIDNCKKIKAFRDQNFSYKNYRIFDMAAWKVKEFIITHPTGRFESWEIVSEDIARLTIGKAIFQDGSVDIPQDITWFFKADSLQSGRRLEIVMVDKDAEYDGYIERESISPAKTRLGWDNNFGRNFEPDVKDQRTPIIEFKRVDDYRYEITLIINMGNDTDRYWPSSEEYPVILSKDDWKRFIQEIEAPNHHGCMRVLACFVDIGGTASPKTLSDKYLGHPSVYTSSVLNTSRRALQVFNMEPCPDGDTQRYFPIAFLGHIGTDVNSGTYEYKMRPELLEALKEINISGIDLKYGKAKDKDEMSKTEFNHNLILYGPPGTGKTYNSVIYAVAICERRTAEDVMKEPYREVLKRYKGLQEAGRIAFTTFHQSYGYEEFIEGIKPKLDNDSETLGYSIEDGVFKDFCRHANSVNIRAKDGTNIKDHPRIWIMILGGPDMTPLKRECFSKNEVRIGWPEVEDGQWDDAEGLSWRAKQMLHAFTYEMEPGDVVFIEKNSQSIDAIGVIAGEYEYDKSLGEYPRKRRVEWIAKNIDEDMVQYLPRGKKQLARFTVYSVDYLGTEILSEILRKYIDEDEDNSVPDIKPYVFIIDEINRGNISKIFGELITLIEDTKRAGASEAMEAILPYSGESFSVPNNVYIIGTMNTADRSIALMDTALRRRFKFAEMMPNSEVLDGLGVGTIAVGDDELNIARMLNVINERIAYLFDREHTIGHAFFTKLADDPSIEMLADIFEKNVIPLLQEYFYEDYEKIQLVLGDNSKEDEFKFILDRAVKIKDIFNGNPDIDLPEKGYTVQHEAFLKLESYKQIGKDL